MLSGSRVFFSGMFTVPYSCRVTLLLCCISSQSAFCFCNFLVSCLCQAPPLHPLNSNNTLKSFPKRFPKKSLFFINWNQKYWLLNSFPCLEFSLISSQAEKIFADDLGHITFPVLEHTHRSTELLCTSCIPKTTKDHLFFFLEKKSLSWLLGKHFSHIIDFSLRYKWSSRNIHNDVLFFYQNAIWRSFQVCPWNLAS